MLYFSVGLSLCLALEYYRHQDQKKKIAICGRLLISFVLLSHLYLE